MKGEIISKSKKIMFVIPSLTFGGVEKFALEYATALKKAGQHPVVVGIGKNGPLSEVLLEREIEHHAFKLRFFVGQTRRSFLQNALHFYLKAKPMKADVWMGISYWCNIMVGLIGPLANARQRIWNQQSVDASIPMGRIERLAKKGINAYAANGLAPINHIAERHEIPTSSIQRLDNVLEAPLRELTPQFSLAQPRKEIRILMVANYFPEKLQTMAIEAVKLLENRRPDVSIRLDLLGRAPGGYFVEQNKALAFDLHLYGKVFFHTDNQVKEQLFKQADLGLLATLSEGYSNSIVEYMAYGLPVLASDILANRDALGNDFAAAYFENTVEAMASAIVALYDNPEMRLAMGKYNLQRARERHIFDPIQCWPF